jgi:hypothetical protein
MRSFTATSVIVSAAITIVVATTGCAYLLFGRCGLYGCPYTQLRSLPPRDNPLAQILERPAKREEVESRLNAGVRGQIGAPASSPCDQAAVGGCRYSILVEEERVSFGAPNQRIQCQLLDIAVIDRAGDRSIARPVYRNTPCPP